MTVRIGAAVRDRQPGGDWLCPVTIVGAPRGTVPPGTHAVYGIDPLQAIVLAIGYAQQALALLQRQSKGKLTWLETTDLGLPDIIGLVGVRRSFRSPGRSPLAKGRAATDRGRRTTSVRPRR